MIYLEVEKEFDSTHIYSVSSVGSHFYGWDGDSDVFTGSRYKLFPDDERIFQALLGPSVLDRWLE